MATPYNSIYKQIKEADNAPKFINRDPTSVEASLVCCTHGGVCQLAHALENTKNEDLTSTYVNLSEAPMETKMETKHEVSTNFSKVPPAETEKLLACLLDRIRAGEAAKMDRKRSKSKNSKNSKSFESRSKSAREHGGSRDDRHCHDVINTAVNKKLIKREVERESPYSYMIPDMTSSGMNSTKEEKRGRGLQLSSDVTKRSQKDERMVEKSLNNLQLNVEIGKKVAPPLNSLASSIYLGALNFAKAEEKITKGCDFGLYHQLLPYPSLNDLHTALQLYLVYRTSQGSYRHYRILKKGDMTSPSLFVECGGGPKMYHPNLDHLVRFYKLHAKLNQSENIADSFAWWEDRKEVSRK